MNGFLGKCINSLDSKNRVFVPAVYRDRLSQGMYINKGTEGNLSLYPADEWEKKIEKMLLEYESEEDRDLMRYYYSNAMPITMDAQGRIIIPQDLKDHAGLEKDVLFNGMFTLLEIWEPSKYEEHMKSIDINRLRNKKSEEMKNAASTKTV